MYNDNPRHLEIYNSGFDHGIALKEAKLTANENNKKKRKKLDSVENTENSNQSNANKKRKINSQDKEQGFNKNTTNDSSRSLKASNDKLIPSSESNSEGINFNQSIMTKLHAMNSDSKEKFTILYATIMCTDEEYLDDVAIHFLRQTAGFIREKFDEIAAPLNYQYLWSNNIAEEIDEFIKKDKKLLDMYNQTYDAVELYHQNRISMTSPKINNQPTSIAQNNLFTQNLQEQRQFQQPLQQQRQFQQPQPLQQQQQQFRQQQQHRSGNFINAEEGSTDNENLATSATPAQWNKRTW